MITNNNQKKAEQIRKDFLNACKDLADYITTQIKKDTEPEKIELVIKNKISIVIALSEQCIDTPIPTEEKIKTLNTALQILNPLPNKIPTNNFGLQLTWLDLISLIASIKQYIAIIAMDPRQPIHHEIIATLLSDLLINIIDPKNLPTIPPPTSPEYRRTLTTLLNTLQDHMVTFDILIETVPFISKQELLHWIKLDIQYYYQFSLIVRKHINKTLYKIYQKTKEEHLFAANYIILHLNLVNLAQLFKTIQQTLNDEWQKHLSITNIIPKNYPQNIEGLTKFVTNALNRALNQLEQWRKTGEILVTEKHYESQAFKELKTGYHYVKAIRLKNQTFNKALKTKPENIAKDPIQKEELSLKFTELSLMWEVLMKTILGNNPLNKDFFKNEQGRDYLEFFSEFLETITLESKTMNDPSIYYEKIRPYHEIFIYITPQTHPKLWMKKAVLELYLLTNTNTTVDLKQYLKDLQKITPALKKIPKEYFALINLQLTIIATNKQMFDEEIFQKTIQQAKQALEDGWFHPTYEKKAKTLLEQINKQYYHQNGDFREFYSHLEINAFDYTTWAIPNLPTITKKQFPLKYFPFNRYADRIV